MQAYNDLIRLCDAAGTRENVFEVIDAMEANKIQLDMDTLQVNQGCGRSAVGASLPSSSSFCYVLPFWHPSGSVFAVNVYSSYGGLRGA